MKNDDLYIYSFYRFLKVINKKSIKNSLDKYFKKRLLRGTILIANEGINASISGKKEDLLDTIKLVKKLLNVRKLNIKINKSSFLPFNRIKVRLKKEIVSLGKGELEVDKLTTKMIHPSNWDSIIQKKSIKLVDTRNIYEIKIGRFKNALNPKTNSFREFPENLNKIGIKKNDNLAIYCTGGIRCEKASAYLKKKGFKNILQLEGGILNYLQYKTEVKDNSLWKGDCFVFDNRVAVNNKLISGKYKLCHGCRYPLTKKNIESKFYIKGVSCHNCFSARTEKQKKSSITRQKQIDLFEKKGTFHSFKKITIENLDN